MSEVDVTGQMLSSFVDVKWPEHFSLASEGGVLVADYYTDRILLLSSQLGLQLERVVVDTELQVRHPRRVCYNELTSQLYVLHRSSSEGTQSSDVISLFNLR